MGPKDGREVEVGVEVEVGEVRVEDDEEEEEGVREFVDRARDSRVKKRSYM